MTVTQFLNDHYVGKYVIFIVNERKDDIDGLYRRRCANFDLWWPEKNWDGSYTDWDKKIGHESKHVFYERHFKAVDKVISIRRYMTYWLLSTLYGFDIKITADESLSIVDDPNDQLHTVITESLKAV